MQKAKVRIASSLGDGFAGTFQEAWGLESYNPTTDNDKPCVFVGLYGLPDFYALWRHKGKKYIFWCGSDILHFNGGYWLDDKGEICLDYIPLAEWINKNCENYVENGVEQQALADFFIKSKVIPSFLGKIEDYPVSFKPGNKVYTSVSGDDFEKYGWDRIEELARKNPKIEFHLYGNKTWPWKLPLTENPFNSVGRWKGNMIVHGRVSQEQMDREIKDMQGALRLTEFDGFSEIIAKSMLWGQWPISLIRYHNTLPLESLSVLPHLKESNLKGREWLIKNVNNYPWCKK